MELALVTLDSTELSGHHSHIGSFAPATKIIISSNFFVLSLAPSESRIVRLEARYATFNGKVSREEAVTAIAEADTHLLYEIADFGETATFGASFPREQEKGPIIGLGLVPVDDEHYGVTCLSAHGKKHSISITARHAKWPANTRFLILRPL